jgi:hypothetical protein
VATHFRRVQQKQKQQKRAEQAFALQSTELGVKMAEEGGISSPDSSLDGSDGSYEAKRGAGASLLGQLGDTRPVEEYVGQYVRTPSRLLFL